MNYCMVKVESGMILVGLRKKLRHFEKKKWKVAEFAFMSNCERKAALFSRKNERKLIEKLQSRNYDVKVESGRL